LVAAAAAAHPDPGVRRVLAARVDRDVGLDLTGQQALNERLREEALVGAEGRRPVPPARARLLEQRPTPARLRRDRAEHVGFQSEQDAVAILHEGADRVARVGPRPRRPFGHVAAVRIGQGAVRGVAALLAAEVDGPVAGVLGPAGLVALLRAQAPLYSSGASATSIGTKLL
jgi:hypothetical protein